ncbi:hypothetical protein Tco_1396778, partial [Tanacetum coccineum]
RRIDFSEYAVLLGKQIRRLDCETQYAVLIRRFDTSYPTGGYGVSGTKVERRLSGGDGVEARGGEWHSGLDRSGDEKQFWFRPENSPEKFFGAGGGGRK